VRSLGDPGIPARNRFISIHRDVRGLIHPPTPYLDYSYAEVWFEGEGVALNRYLHRRPRAVLGSTTPTPEKRVVGYGVHRQGVSDWDGRADFGLHLGLSERSEFLPVPTAHCRDLRECANAYLRDAGNVQRSISASRSPRQRENLCEEIGVRGLGLDADACPDTTDRPSNPAKPFRAIRLLFLCFSSASFLVSAGARGGSVRLERWKIFPVHPEYSMIDVGSTRLSFDLMVARGGIEPPTRGFSVSRSNTGNLLTLLIVVTGV
jgi:hypothetical protein